MSKVKEFRTKDKKVKEEMDRNFLKIIEDYKKYGDLEKEKSSKDFYKEKIYI